MTIASHGSPSTGSPSSTLRLRQPSPQCQSIRLGELMFCALAAPLKDSKPDHEVDRDLDTTVFGAELSPTRCDLADLYDRTRLGGHGSSPS